MVLQRSKQITSQSCWCSTCPGVVADMVLPLPCLAQVLLWVPAISLWRRRTGWKLITVILLGSSAGSLGMWMSVWWGDEGDTCVIPHTSPWELVLTPCGRRTWVGEGQGAIQQQALTVPQGLYCFCWLKSDVILGHSSVCLSASVVRYAPEGTARGQSGQPPAAEALVRSSALALSRLPYRVIPAQSEPQEMLSFTHLSCCPWLMAVREPPHVILQWEGIRAQGASHLACRHLRDEEMLI